MLLNPVIFILLSSLFSLNLCENCNHLPTHFYEDIGCQPVVDLSKTCPVSYKCGDFKRSPDYCLYRSEKVKVGDSAKSPELESACRFACLCQKRFNDMSNFVCASVDCHHWYGPGGCYGTYNVEDCCSSGHKCPPFGKDFSKCIVNQTSPREYKEGEKFYPDDTCLKCACGKGFDGKFEAPFCSKIVCAEQMDHSEELEKGCAPVFLRGKTLCCADTFLCPSDQEELAVTKKNSTATAEECKWGHLNLNLGDSFNATVKYFSDTRNVSCQCILPPLVTCVGE